MPKSMIALISGALTFIIGFLLGALFTVPQNREMEELVNAKTEMSKKIELLQKDNKKLDEENLLFKKEVQDLKDK
jgi:cell division protein FtsB